MAVYKIEWKTSAERDIGKIDRRMIIRIISAVDTLNTEPFPEGCRKLEGASSSYRIRLGDYRVIYQVDKKRKTVTVVHVRHRKDAYRN